MKTASAETFSPASMLCTRRPDAWTCTSESATMTAIATSACGVRTSGTPGSGRLRSGVRSPAAGTKRPM